MWTVLLSDEHGLTKAFWDIQEQYFWDAATFSFPRG